MQLTEKKIRVLLQQSIPCWYEIGFRNADAIIVIRIHEAFLVGIEGVPEKSPLVRYFEDLRNLNADLFLGGFEGSFQADTFGFYRALVKQPRRVGDPFVEYWGKIPIVHFYTHEACHRCGGTKERYGEECGMCYGSGKQGDCDYTSAYALQISLKLLMSQLSVPPEIDFDIPRWQALSLECDADSGKSVSGVWGEMSPDMLSYLKRLLKNELDDLIHSVSEAVMVAHATLMGRPSDPYAFRKSLDQRGMYFGCPGNATAIEASFEGVHSGPYGAQFAPHNVDSPIQGLSLFAGVAKLSELVQAHLTRKLAETSQK